MKFSAVQSAKLAKFKEVFVSKKVMSTKSRVTFGATNVRRKRSSFLASVDVTEFRTVEANSNLGLTSVNTILISYQGYKMNMF